VECFVNLMSCLDEEREIVREDAAMGLDWDRKKKLLESAVVAVVMLLSLNQSCKKRCYISLALAIKPETLVFRPGKSPQDAFFKVSW
jgi:hypothetical protein